MVIVKIGDIVKVRNLVYYYHSIGTAKELYDSRPSGTGWSWHDIAYDIAGAIAGYSLY
ncbi:putative lipoprotein [Xenorhabdus japonica]|uniref:Putative lipoprotein n=1 Tax=Xenorhabdus japonica TaxID=53341 RepID=A0A1I4ZLE8_9GAMM|nr:putative lipoprotein [Xenorhabdus japonica]